MYTSKIKKGLKGFVKIEPHYHSRPLFQLPEGVQEATMRQKVSRVLTGCEGVLLSFLVQKSVTHPTTYALPISLDYDGVTLIVRKSPNLNVFIRDMSAALDKCSLRLLGCQMPLTPEFLTEEFVQEGFHQENQPS